MKATIATAATALLVLASCTYEEGRKRLDVAGYVIADDGSKGAFVTERDVRHRPTGIAAFPTGGVSKVTGQFVDVYVVDMASKKILYRHAIDPPGRGSMHALNVWLLGWQGDDIYVKMTGCLPGFWTSYKGCYGERRQAYVYRVSLSGVEPADEPAPPLPRYRYLGGAASDDAQPGKRSFLSTREGVWIQHGMRGPREQLLRISGQELKEVVD